MIHPDKISNWEITDPTLMCVAIHFTNTIEKTFVCRGKSYRRFRNRGYHILIRCIATVGGLWSIEQVPIMYCLSIDVCEQMRNLCCAVQEKNWFSSLQYGKIQPYNKAYIHLYIYIYLSIYTESQNNGSNIDAKYSKN